MTKLPKSTIEAYIRRLREADLIEFKGDSAQTGGYYLTGKMKLKLK
jgi:ATP-dependent DNA helicase RecG